MSRSSQKLLMQVWVLDFSFTGSKLPGPEFDPLAFQVHTPPKTKNMFGMWVWTLRV